MNWKSVALISLISLAPIVAHAQAAHDPGVRGGTPGAGKPLPGLSAQENGLFTDGLATFSELEAAKDGLGPRFNLNQCSGCHSQPAIGGTSPASNPEIGVASLLGATNKIPLFILPNGPVREARFKFQPENPSFRDRDRGLLPDGGVHDLFTITGRTDAPGCAILQDDFNSQYRKGNVSLRIPTPVFGGGLIESITDTTILANQAANAATKQALGISGHPNRNGNDGTITRFGWKAQNKSLLIFSGEAYNVEMGISNSNFPQERDENAKCQFSSVPNDADNDIGGFTAFMNFLDQPTPSTTVPGGQSSILRGRDAFAKVGCAMCHTPTLTTQPNSQSPALSNISANLFSDLLVHHMGPKLADDITQGAAAGDEFRSAPLWGVGQRIFFLHDGRTNDLIQTILAHSSAGNEKFGPSEANATVAKFSALPANVQQDLLNFLRSL